MKTDFKFGADSFWQLIEMQKKRCFLTSRILTPLNCEVELRNPNKAEGRFGLDNFYLICSDLKYLCRHLSEQQVVELCAEVIQHRGKDFGYSLRRTRHE